MVSVVEEVLCKLNAKKVDVPQYFSDDDGHVEHIIERLGVDSGGVSCVGICGMGGIGKTTIAKVVFNQLISHFDGASFLNDIRESSRHGFMNLQKKLLSSFVGSVIADQIEDNGVVMNWIKRVCETRKVIIVLDDLSDIVQFQNLVEQVDWFDSGSRIIITTRNKSLLRTLYKSSNEQGKEQTKDIWIYEVNCMDIDKALRLFCNHAFKRDFPIEEYKYVAVEIVQNLGGHRLLNEVIGSYLYYHGSNLEPSDKMQLWQYTWRRLREIPFQCVHEKMMISYERLDKMQKEVFLDIACFYTNEDQTYPVIMWEDCNYHPESAKNVLRQLSIIKVRDNKFWMHDSFRDLGRHINQKEYPHRFSRVWDLQHAVDLLRRKERNEDVKALSLISSGYSHNFGPEELVALPNLRFLRLKGVEFSGNFENLLSELRWLSWQIWHATFHANNFHFNNLVVLDLSDSNIKDDWGGWSQMKMNRLKVLDLAGCKCLKRTPDFSNFLTLEMLSLARCVKLTKIDSSIRKLVHLNTLNLEGCSSLGDLPEEVVSFGPSLQIFKS